MLKDRPFSGELKKLKKAVGYAMELDALPLDLLALKCEVCRWEGNVTGLAEGIKEFDKIGYKLLSMEYEAILANMKSGKEKIDLTFVPKKKEETVVELSNQEKLDQLDQQILDAKAEMQSAAAAGDQNGMQAARKKAKDLKKAKKELKKAIDNAEEDDGKAKQAKIDEIKTQIADAMKRQDQAFDDDDDEAEEAAAAEVTKLMTELSELTGGSSIAKKKLQDAKAKDEFLTFLKFVEQSVGGQDLGFSNSIKMNFGEIGVIVFDGGSGIMEIASEDRTTECSMSMAWDTFSKIQSKALDFNVAMGDGLITVDGDMNVMMGMQAIFAKMEEAASTKK